MNTLTLAWRDTAQNWRRFVLTVVSVVLGIAFLTATLGLRDQMAETIESAAASTVTGDVVVRGRGEGLRPPLPIEMVSEVTAIDGVAKARAVQETAITFIDDAGHADVSAGFNSRLVTDLSDFEPWTLEGRAPSGDDEVLVESSALERLGKKVGDEITWRTDVREVTTKVVGTISTEAPLRAANLLMADEDFIASLVSAPQAAQSIVVSVEAGEPVERVISAISDEVGEGYEVHDAPTVKEEETKTVQDALGFATTLLLVFIVIALGVSTFIIANTFAMAIRARQKQFALLRAVGAYPSLIFTIVTLQAVIIGLVGAALGVAAGMGLLALATWGLERFGLVDQITAEVSPRIIVIAFVLAVLVTVLGSLISARRAAQTKPLEAIRSGSGAREPSTRWRTLIGTLLLLPGAAVTYVAATQEISHAGPILGAGIAAMVLGTLIASPGYVTGVLGLLGYPARHARSVTARLGASNTLRNPRRTAATASALLIGAALVAAASVLGASLRASLSDSVSSTMNADLMIFSTARVEPIPAQVIEDAKATEGVTSTRELGLAYLPLVDPDHEGQTLIAAMADLSHLNDDFEIEMKSGKLADAAHEGVILHEATAEAYGWKVGDKINIVTGDGPQELEVRAIQQEDAFAQFALLSDEVAKAKGVNSTGAVRLAIHVCDTCDVKEVRDAIRDHLPANGTLLVVDKDDIVDFLGQLINQVLSVVYALVALSIVIATLGVVNTLALSVSERRREIALQRALGLSRRSVAASLTFESVLIAIYGALLGTAVGVASGAALVRYLFDDQITTLTIPASMLAYLALGAVVIGVLAAALPAWRASRQPIVSSIAAQ